MAARPKAESWVLMRVFMVGSGVQVVVSMAAL